MRFSTLATMFSILFNTSNSFLYTSDYINCMVRNNFIPTDCIDNIYNNRILQEQEESEFNEVSELDYNEEYEINENIDYFDTYSISTSTSTSISTSTSTSTSTSISTSVYNFTNEICVYDVADYNKDYFINILDVVLLVNDIIEGYEINDNTLCVYGDMNNDKLLNIIDVISVLNQILSEGRRILLESDFSILFKDHTEEPEYYEQIEYSEESEIEEYEEYEEYEEVEEVEETEYNEDEYYSDDLFSDDDYNDYSIFENKDVYNLNLVLINYSSTELLLNSINVINNISVSSIDDYDLDDIIIDYVDYNAELKIVISDDNTYETNEDSNNLLQKSKEHILNYYDLYIIFTLFTIFILSIIGYISYKKYRQRRIYNLALMKEIDENENINEMTHMI